MHAIVVGAGVVGLTTAHQLQRQGFSVTVLEQHHEPALVASAKNGGQLAYGFADPLGSPAILGQLANSLLKRDHGIRIGFSLSPAFLRWGLMLLRNSTKSRSKTNTCQLLKFAARSQQLMHQLYCEHSHRFAYRPAGKFVLLNHMNGFTRDICQLKTTAGMHVQIMSPTDAIKLEPALANFKCDWRHALFSGQDEVGDPQAFSRYLTERLRGLGVKFQFGTTVSTMRTVKTRYQAINTSSGGMESDVIVFCTGLTHGALGQQLALAKRLQAVRGYSLSTNLGSAPLNASVTIADARIVFARLGPSLRVAGLADIGTSVDPKPRMAYLQQQASKLAPSLFDADMQAECWMGFRPTTANSLPIVEALPTHGAYLNLGHGMLGWTLAAASAEQVSDLVLQAL